MKPRRGVDFSGLAESAGIMASSKGSDTVAPTPLRNVRLRKAFLVTNIMRLSCCALIEIVQPLAPRRLCFGGRRGLAHLEGHALNYSENQRTKSVIVTSGSLDNGADGRPIIVLHIAADAIHHQLLSDSGYELLGVAEQSRFQS